MRRGRRLAPQARRAALLDVAAALVMEQGYLPLAVQDLAEAAKVSGALVYRYFPQPRDLYEALLDRAGDALAAAGLEQAARSPDPAQAATAAAEIYFRFVCAAGPVAQIVARDGFMRGRSAIAATALRDRTCRALAAALRRRYGLSVREAVTCVGVGMTLPEECGRLVHRGDLDPAQGSALCRDLVLGVIDVAAARCSVTGG